MDSTHRRSKSRRALMLGLILGGVAAVVAAVLWVVMTPTKEGASVESTLHLCADLFEARHWDGLAQQAWPVESRERVRDTLEKRVPQGFRIQRPVSHTRPVIEGDKATINVTVEWSLAMGRLRDTARMTVSFVRKEGRWYVDASDMNRWWP